MKVDKSFLLNRVWRSFLVQLVMVVIIFACLFAVLIYLVQDKVEQDTVEYNTQAQVELISHSLLEHILVEDKVSLLQRSTSLIQSMPELLHLSVFNESNELLAQSTKQERSVVEQGATVDIRHPVIFAGETFGFLEVSRKFTKDIQGLRNQFWLLHWFYIVMVLALLVYCVVLLYVRTRSILLNAQFQAFHDPMTRLPNRRMLAEFSAREYRRAARDENSLGVLMIDIDHFKQYNDNYGHSAGDDVIKRVANVLGTSLKRGSDIAVRYGGEEFLVMCTADEEGCQSIAERCRCAVKGLNIKHVDNECGLVTVSVGYVTLHSQDLPPQEDPVHKADKALYRAKQMGRDQCVSYASLEMDNVRVLKSV